MKKFDFNDKKCFTNLPCDRTSTNDPENSELPMKVSTDENVKIIHEMVWADRCLREIFDAIVTSYGNVVSTLNEFKKLSARWVQHLLPIEYKRVTNSKDYLKLFKRKPNEFLCNFVILDETWIRYCTPQIKQVFFGEPATKKADYLHKKQ